MRILIIGNERQCQEAVQRFGPDHSLLLVHSYDDIEQLDDIDLTIDLLANPKYTHTVFISFPKPVLFNAACVTLIELIDITQQPRYGVNGLPGFLQMPLLEVSIADRASIPGLQRLMAELKVDFRIVEDRVGMVTPRIICMIINEAYYTVQEGTATREDIDLAMKLGTNYPFGPFEWCQRIGISQVFELLNQVYEDTQDPRYKISPLLKREYLSSKGKKQY